MITIYVMPGRLKNVRSNIERAAFITINRISYAIENSILVNPFLMGEEADNKPGNDV